MSKVFITGASSFLGSELVDFLKDKHEVVVLEHTKRLGETAGVKIINGGLENILNWQSALFGIETVIHMAGVTHTKDIGLYQKINTKGTEDLIASAQKYGVKQFIFISTRAIGENCGAYGASKALAEEIVKKSNLNFTILRIAEAYDDNFSGKEGLSSIASLIEKSLFVPYIKDSGALSPIHKNDVTRAIEKCIGNQVVVSKTYTLSGPEDLSFKEIEKRIIRYKKLKRILVPVPKLLMKLYSKTPDQWQRFICYKESLSQNVLSDLGITPRKFLK